MIPPSRAQQVKLFVAGVAGAGLLGAFVAWLWPSDPGVVLRADESLQAGLIVGALCLGLGLIQGLVAFLKVGPGGGHVRTRAAAAMAVATGAPLGVWCLNALCEPGEPASAGAWAVVLLGCIAFGGLLRTRFAVGGLVLGMGGALVALGLSPDAPTGADEVVGPDVWVITLDTARADHFDFVGLPGPHAHTPNLSALADQSVVYTQAFSTSALTGPAHTSLWSGQEPQRNGVITNGQRAPEGGPWLPELLADAGWVTTGLVSAAVLDEVLGFGRGFDAFDSTARGRLERGHAGLRFLGHDPTVGTDFSRSGRETIGLVDALPMGVPRLTWVHLYDAHWPYEPTEAAAARVGLDDASALPSHDDGGIRRLPDPDERELDPALVARGRQLYRAELEVLDAVVGELLAKVPDEAVLVVVGDHGESLDEHDYHFSHGRLPHSPDTQVPLLIRIPGEPPARINAAVSVVDIAPTVLTAVGLPVPEAFDGVALQTAPEDRVVRSLTPLPLMSMLRKPGADGDARGKVAGVALRDGQQTWLWTQFWGYQRFDRARDPRELVPLGDVPESVRAELDALAEAGGGRGTSVVPETLKALEALGYVEEGGGSEPSGSEESEPPASKSSPAP